MLIILLALLGVLAVAILASALKSRTYSETTVVKHYDDEDDDEPVVVGELKRQYSNGQPYVIDPVDNEKIYLNTKDTYYEDAGNKNWRLV